MDSKIIHNGTRIGGALGDTVILADCSLLNVGGPADTPSAGPRSAPHRRAGRSAVSMIAGVHRGAAAVQNRPGQCQVAEPNGS